MADLVRRLGLRGGGQAPRTFPASFKPSFRATESILGGGAGAGGAPAQASLLQFDGTSTFVAWSTGLSTAGTGRRATLNFVFNRKGGSGAECMLYLGTGAAERLFIGFDATNHLVCRVSDGAATPATILEIVSTTTYSDSANHVGTFSFDLDTIGGLAFYWQFVDGADVGGAPTTGVAGDVDFGDTLRIGSTDDSANRLWYSGAAGMILLHESLQPLPDANTIKYFYDPALDGPVDQGADGSAALGDVPPLYWVPTSANAVNNQGDGGDADSASTFSDADGPPSLAPLPAFTANAVQFDDGGAGGDFIDWGAPGPGDNAKLFIMLSFKRDRNATLEIPFSTDSGTDNLRIQFGSDDSVFLALQDGAAARWVDTIDGLSVSDITSWHTLLISCDAATFTTTDLLSIIHDGASFNMASAADGSGLLGLNAPWGLAHQEGNTTRNVDGALAECLVAVPDSYIDLDDPATLAKFYANGKPVFQGLTGMKGTGVKPAFYMRGPASLAHLNVGSMAHGTVTGTLTDAASSPTD